MKKEKIEEMLAKLATKEELKKEVSKLATKEELKKTNKKIDDVEKNLSKKIDDNSKKIDANGKKIDNNSKRLDRVAFQVIENKEAIDRMVTKDEFNEFKNELYSTLDKILTTVQKLDKELIFTTEWIRRIDTDVEVLKKR